MEPNILLVHLAERQTRFCFYQNSQACQEILIKMAGNLRINSDFKSQLIVRLGHVDRLFKYKRDFLNPGSLSIIAGYRILNRNMESTAYRLMPSDTARIAAELNDMKPKLFHFSMLSPLILREIADRTSAKMFFIAPLFDQQYLLSIMTMSLPADYPDSFGSINDQSLINPLIPFLTTNES